MAYVTQYDLDMQKQKQMDQGLGMVLQGIQGFDENRRRALETKRAQGQQALKFAELGINPTEEEVKELNETGSSKTLFDKYAQKANETKQRQLDIQNLELGEKKYKQTQRTLPLEERDDYKTKVAGYEAQEKLRIDADNRSRAREDERKKYEAVDGIRKELSGFKPVQDMQQIDVALGKIKTAPDSAAGDMSKIFAYMKILDPNSTVREGEYASAEQARGIPEGMLEAYNRTLKGTRLSANQRKDFENAAMQLASSQYANFESATQPHRNRVKELQVDEGQVLPSFSQQDTIKKFRLEQEAQKRISGFTPEQKMARRQQLLMKAQSQAAK